MPDHPVKSNGFRVRIAIRESTVIPVLALITLSACNLSENENNCVIYSLDKYDPGIIGEQLGSTDTGSDNAILLGPVLSWPKKGETGNTTSVRVWWHLEKPENIHRISYGPTPDLGRETQTELPGERYPFVELTGLIPGTRWWYRVSSGETVGVVHSFVAPEATASTDQPVRFAAWADNQDGCKSFNELTVPLLKKLQPDFLIAAGDIVQNGDRYEEWGAQLFGPARDLLAQIPWLPARGNHDARSPQALAMLPNSNEVGAWNATTIGGIRFVVIDTTDDFSTGSPQGKWLDAELTSLEWTTARFRVASFHHLPWTNFWSTSGYTGETSVRRELMPILLEASPDVVITGHAHLYEHGVLKNSLGGETHIFTIGGGGGALDTERVANWPHILRSESVHHVVTFEAIRESAPDPHKALDVLTARVIATTGTSLQTSGSPVYRDIERIRIIARNQSLSKGGTIP